MMTKWEYRVKDIGAILIRPEGQTEILNHLGKDGWELVGLLATEQGEFAYFKREIEPDIPVYKDGVRIN